MSIDEIFAELKLARKRKPIPKSIVNKALREVDVIKTIPYRKKKHPDFFWGENPYKDDSLIINLPHIELKELKPYRMNFTDKVIIYDEKRLKKEKIKYIDKSCVVTYQGEILIVYVTEEYDKAITKATEKLVELGVAMEKYYPVKDHTFYTPFKLTANKDKQQEAYEYKNKQHLTERYYGKNWMDGQIKYYMGRSDGGTSGSTISYQPRKPEAFQDKEFLFNLVYTYCALYELEKRYAPSVAKWRLELAKDAEKIPAIPGVPLERHPATGCGASLDFASAIHNDSGMNGLTETIFWNIPAAGQEQYFISPQIGFAFDLTKRNAIILQPPKIPHGTMNSGDHNGYGYVNITKQNLVAETDLNKQWYNKWRKYLNSQQAEKDFA